MLDEMQGVAQKYRKRVRDAIRRPQNFFKHAEADPKELIDFNPEGTDFLILDAIESYQLLTDESVPLLHACKVWIFLRYPEIMNEAHRKKFQAVMSGVSVELTSKAEFLASFLTTAMRQGVA